MKNDIIVNMGGINWSWYHWLTVDDNVATVTHSDRFHKFNDQQNAGEPKTDFYGDIYTNPKGINLSWGEARIARFWANWKESCVKHGLSPDADAMICIRCLNSSENHMFELRYSK